MGTLAILAFIGYVAWDNQREPDYTAEALKRITEPCEVIGVWRNDDYPELIEGLRNTMVMCDAADGRKVWTIYDDSWGEKSVLIDDTGYALGTTADVYTVNADGSLTISDQDGEIITLPPTGEE